MPRPLVFGNGNLLIGIDECYCIRDLFYPQVGLSNHLNGHRIGMGVWVDGRFAWTEDPSWKRLLAYRKGTLTGQTTLENSDLQLRLDIEESVSLRSNDFVRHINVTNLSSKTQEVILLFTHDLRIMESDVGDTALFNPYLDALIHYKGPCYFLFGGSTSLGGIFEYATGIKGFGGLEGTWRDAEDGRLSMHPISQGSVDSTISLRLKISPEKTEKAYYWIVCGDKLETVTRNYHRLVHDGFQNALDDTSQYWQAWSDKAYRRTEGLPEEIRNQFSRSFLVMRTQIDNQGAIIAANDTDIMKTNRATYSYMWPRDGAFVSSVFDRVGFHLIPRRFFEFCRKILPTDRPMFHHKYMADGSVGATWHPWIVNGKPESPFQEDETALTIQALWKHYEASGDIDFLYSLFDTFTVPAADFIARYRDPVTHLPMASYDLWEERRGIHTFTTAAVITGLKAASQICKALGNEERSRQFMEAALETTDALKKHLFDSNRGVFLRRLNVEPDGALTPDHNIDSATLLVGLHEALPIDDPMVKSNTEVVERTLWVNSNIGGMARYEGDYYFRQSNDYPGNPWIICTMWLAQTQIMAAKSSADLEKPLELLKWATNLAATTGVFPEQIHPTSGEHLSVSPLTWSHAEFAKTVMDYLDKQKSFEM
jgi:GH15 family glucan-1,4-alpha-glucosidase